MNNTLSTPEYVTLCGKRQATAIERGEFIKARSFQLRIDNATGASPRGKLPFSIFPVAPKLPNRKERRIPVQGKPKAAHDQIKIDTQNDARGPVETIANKEREVVESARRDLYAFVKNDLVWGSKVDANDEIIIYSKEPVSLPATHRGFVVKNLVGSLPESKV